MLLVGKTPGLTDRQITAQLLGASAPQQSVNIAARGLASKGRLVRRRRDDGVIGNFPVDAEAVHAPLEARVRETSPNADLLEDRLKHHLREWLRSNGWEAEIAWGHEPGIDIRAFRDGKRWIIEVKGIGSRPEMRVNYFIGILGETLQRMDDPASKYSISLPDVPQFRRLWDRLPHLAKKRTEITVLFVDARGQVKEVSE